MPGKDRLKKESAKRKRNEAKIEKDRILKENDINQIRIEIFDDNLNEIQQNTDNENTKDEDAEFRKYRAEKQRKRISSKDGEELSQFRKQRADQERHRISSKDKDELAEFKKQRAVQERQRISSKDEDKLAEFKKQRADQERQRISSKDEDELAEFKKQRAEKKRQRISSQDEDELAEFKKQRAEQERQRILSKDEDDLAEFKKQRAEQERQRLQSKAIEESNQIISTKFQKERSRINIIKNDHELKEKHQLTQTVSKQITTIRTNHNFNDRQLANGSTDYFERQTPMMSLCGLHAINNAMQMMLLNKIEMFNIATHLQEKESMMNPRCGVDNFCNAAGNFNISVLIEAFRRKGYTLQYVLAPDQERFIRNNTFDDGRYILHRDDHYIAIIKCANRNAYIIDSLEDRAHTILDVTNFMTPKNQRTYGLFVSHERNRDNQMIVKYSSLFKIVKSEDFDQLRAYLVTIANTPLLRSDNQFTGCKRKLNFDELSSPVTSKQQPITKIMKIDQSATKTVQEIANEEIMAMYEKKVEKWTMKLCVVCSEIFYIEKSNQQYFKCKTCQANLYTTNYYAEHDPLPMPSILIENQPTFFEEQLLSAVFVSQYIYVRSTGSIATKGHCLNFAQRISDVATVFPRLPKDVPLVIVEYRDQAKTATKDMIVRKKVIEVWLHFLKKHSNVPVYRNMVIDYERLNALPDNGPIDTENGFRTVLLDETPVNAPQDLNLQAENADIDGNPTSDSGFPLPPEQQSSDIQAMNTILNSLTSQSGSLVRIPFPEVSSVPMSEFETAFLATMAFPTLFPTGDGDPFDFTRNSSKMTTLERIKHCIRYGEIRENKLVCRFASHPRFVLWINNIYYRKLTLSQGNIYLKQNLKDANISADKLRSMIDKTSNARPVLNNMRRYMANITGTPSYWFDVNAKLKAIIEAKGPPHLFFTFSFPDRHCPFLISFLGLEPDTPIEVVTKAIRENPQSVNWFFLRRFKEFKKQWLKRVLKGNIKDGGWIFYRFEFQNRGALHVHGMVKMGGDAPNTYLLAEKVIKAHLLKMEKKEAFSDEDKVVLAESEAALECLEAFQDSLICTDIPIKYCDYLPPQSRLPAEKLPMKLKPSEVVNQERDNLDLTVVLQRHICVPKWCLQGANQECRYKFPKSLNSKTRFEVAATKLANGHVMYSLNLKEKRVNDTRIINHNADQLNYWRGNCDCSVMYDVKRVIAYVTKYATKPEQRSDAFTSAFKSVFNECSINTTNTREGLLKVMTSVLSQRDISHQEALHQTIGHPLYESNLTVVNMSLENSVRVRKLLENDEVLYDTSFLELYAKRVEKVEKKFGKTESDIVSALNFIQFATHYEQEKGTVKKRSKTDHIVIRILQRFSSNPKSEQFQDHCKYQLLRYKPWQFTHENALGNEECWVNAWKLFLVSDYGKSVVNNWSEELVSKAEEYITKNDIDLDDLLGDMNQEEVSDAVERTPPCLTTMPPCQAPIKNITSYTQYWNNIRNLYTEEEIAGYITWLHDAKKSFKPVEQTIEDEEFQSSIPEQQLAFNIVQDWANNGKTQLLMRLEGPGGTGKSYIIHALKKFCKKKCVIGAPTGKAANNIGGNTLHSLLFLPVKKGTMKDLSDLKLQTMQSLFEDDPLLIIDEYSMCGSRLFNRIDRRLRQATGRDQELFGGISVLLAGDPKQLPPVLDTILWKPINSKSDEEVVGGHMAFKRFETVVLLMTNVRVELSGQNQFREALNRLRMAESTEEDFNLFQTRFLGRVYGQDLEDFNQAMHIYQQNDQVNDLNDKMRERLEQKGHLAARIESQNTGYGSQQYPADELGGLEPHITLTNESRVMITSNYWTDVGIFNGATGTVRHILFEKDHAPNSLPQVILIEMDENYHGPHIENHERLIALPFRVMHTEGEKGMIERVQYGIKLAFAVTVYKVQGQTLRKAYVNIGNSEQQLGSTYVAMSRVKRLEDMMLAGFTWERLKKITSMYKELQFNPAFDKLTSEHNQLTKIRFSYLI